MVILEVAEAKLVWSTIPWLLIFHLIVGKFILAYSQFFFGFILVFNTLEVVILISSLKLRNNDARTVMTSYKVKGLILLIFILCFGFALIASLWFMGLIFLFLSNSILENGGLECMAFVLIPFVLRRVWSFELNNFLIGSINCKYNINFVFNWYFRYKLLGLHSTYASKQNKKKILKVKIQCFIVTNYFVTG